MALLLALAGCNDAGSDRQVYEPVAFHPATSVTSAAWRSVTFPAPRGGGGQTGAMKFCSTAELFGWWLQTGKPGTRYHPPCARHGRARPGRKPDDDALIDARQAFWRRRRKPEGAMRGPHWPRSPAKRMPKAFAAKQGGRLVRFRADRSALLQPESIRPRSHGGPAAH